MLHIHNGDSSAGTAKQATLPGRHFAWRESLITGPTPAGLAAARWRRVRAEHLSESYGGDIEECEQSLLSQEETLASFSEHDEVVLWFEHDLFCQVHLLYLLNWFSQYDLGQTKLSLVCIGDFPGKENFRGLGELNAEQLASLFPTRQPVTSAQLNLAASAWEAYCSPDPTGMEKLLQVDTSPLPYLRAALEAHLRRFPATENGLGRIENRVLQLIHEGMNSFSNLFLRFGDLEPVYGFGDAQFWLTLQRLSAAPKPLVEITPTGVNDERSQTLIAGIPSKASLKLTALGESVLKREADFILLNGIDFWLGGVHLHNEDDVWRWNQQSATLVSPPEGPI